MELKTMQDALDEYAANNEFISFDKMVYEFEKCVIPRSVFTQHVKEAMKLYAIQIAEAACKEQREMCAKNAFTRVEEVYNGGLDPEKLSMYDEIQVVDEDSILSAPQPDIEKLLK